MNNDKFINLKLDKRIVLSTPNREVKIVLRITEIIYILDITNINDISNITEITNISELTRIANITNVTEIIRITEVSNIAEITHIADIARITDIAQITGITYLLETETTKDIHICKHSYKVVKCFSHMSYALCLCCMWTSYVYFLFFLVVVFFHVSGTCPRTWYKKHLSNLLLFLKSATIFQIFDQCFQKFIQSLINNFLIYQKFLIQSILFKSLIHIFLIEKNVWNSTENRKKISKSMIVFKSLINTFQIHKDCSNQQIFFKFLMDIFRLDTKDSFQDCHDHFKFITFFQMHKHCVKSVCIRSYFGPHFPAFGLNTERYFVSLSIQSGCRKMRTRITPNTDTFYAVICKPFQNNTPLKIWEACGFKFQNIHIASSKQTRSLM